MIDTGTEALAISHEKPNRGGLSRVITEQERETWIEKR